MNQRLHPRSNTPSLVLHSVFKRGAATLICDLYATGRRHFDITVMSANDAASAVVESFQEGAKAIRRHAELSWLLRESGWERLIEATPSAA